MAIEDLDLEFEDDEVKEVNDAITVDVDLSFFASPEPKSNKPANVVVGKGPALSASDATDPSLNLAKLTNNTVKSPTQARPATPPNPAARPQTKPTQPTQQVTAKTQAVPASSPKAAAPTNNVANMKDHPTRANAAPVAQAKVVTQELPVSLAVDDYQYELQLLRQEMAELRSQMQSIQMQADVKVAVAEAKAQFMIEQVTNGKLLDHQVNQVLQRIHQKVPALKTEVLTIKKYLTEFLQKSEKKKE